MSAPIIIDRRKSDKGKNITNRRKFLKRVKSQLADAVRKKIIDGDIEDIVNNSTKDVTIPGKGLKKPSFHHGNGGIKEFVLPENDRFIPNDRIPKPLSQEGESGNGKNASNSEDVTEDDFTFILTQQEFLDLFFDGLELPDLVKKQLATIEEYEMKRAGYSTDGSPARLNVVRTMRQAKGRSYALRSPLKRKLKKAEQQLKDIKDRLHSNSKTLDPIEIQDLNNQADALNKQIKALKRKLKAIPFVDDVDLRYNRWEKTPIPITKAVMFNIMDVSGSMGEYEKEMSKRFFMMLYLFLVRNYQQVELVFIRHHTTPKEVNQQEFFYGRESGGTLVSPALELMNTIIEQRYPLDQYNIFGTQASDGDNWPEDNEKAVKVLTEQILPKVQYFAYVEITDPALLRTQSDLWPYYKAVEDAYDNMAITIISDKSEIYPVFRRLFEAK